MKIEKINELYQKFGIGTEEERKKYVEWAQIEQENEYTFIRYTNNSLELEEEKNKIK